jgi:pimeloyl-ACP methyl ester carboxylesterase
MTQPSKSSEGSQRQEFAVARVAAGAVPLYPNLLFGVGMPLGFGRAHRPDDSGANQIEPAVARVEYAEDGPADGPAVILVHGWPYGIHSYVDVVPLLAAKGYRVIIPYLCGHDTTCLPSSGALQNGRQFSAAHNILQLMDDLKIQKAILAGLDWGARTANIMAALWPERCKVVVSVGGHLLGDTEPNEKY